MFQDERIRTVAVVGSGLAAEAALAALSARLGSARRIVHVRTDDAPSADLFYGTMSGPWAAPFQEAAGLSEAALLQEPGTALSWGTAYRDWGPANRAWVQCHHQPLPPLGGAGFHHVLARLGIALPVLLLPAVAASRGTFAHPNADPASPLSRAEYGYHFDPSALAAAFAKARMGRAIETVRARIQTVGTAGGAIGGLRLDDGSLLEADLYIDATGPGAALWSALGGEKHRTRTVSLLAGGVGGASEGSCRTLTAASYGWQATTPLRGGALRTTLFHPAAEAEARAAHGGEPEREASITLGRVDRAWLGNCVAIGQAAAALDPLTSAPLLLLYRDISRLLELIPIGEDQSVERREYNRRFAEDATHADLFTGGFFAGEGLDTPYWREAASATADPKLERKIAQFESRGLLVQYDLEPFNAEDWLILHHGLGRRPRRYDRQADALPEAAVRRELDARREVIAALAARMPPAGRYLDRYLEYLERNP